MSNSSKPVGDLANTGWRFGHYRLAIWSIPVVDLANTGEVTFSKIWAGLRSKSGIPKTWGVLELPIWDEEKKIDFGYRSVPLIVSHHHHCDNLMNMSFLPCCPPSPRSPWNRLHQCCLKLKFQWQYGYKSITIPWYYYRSIFLCFRS